MGKLKYRIHGYSRKLDCRQVQLKDEVQYGTGNSVSKINSEIWIVLRACVISRAGIAAAASC